MSRLKDKCLTFTAEEFNCFEQTDRQTDRQERETDRQTRDIGSSNQKSEFI